MPKKLGRKREGTSRDHDFTVRARSVLEKAIGEHLDGTPLEDEEKDPKLVQRARKAGLVGGHARARRLSSREKREIARKAAQARWKK